MRQGAWFMLGWWGSSGHRCRPQAVWRSKPATRVSWSSSHSSSAMEGRSVADEDRPCVGGADDEGDRGGHPTAAVFGALRHYLRRKCPSCRLMRS